MTKYGYARVSTEEQNLDLQLAAFKRAGIDVKHIYTDKISGKKWGRKGLNQLLSLMQEGDTLVVWKLDRLGRSLRELVTTVEDLQSDNNKMHFQSLTENIDTSTASGNMFFQIMCVLAEFERELIRERTIAGLAIAKAKGHTSGKKPLDITQGRPKEALAYYHAHNNDMQATVKRFKVSRQSVYYWLRVEKAISTMPIDAL